MRLAWAVEALGEVPAAHLAPRDADRLYVLDDHRARRAAERVLPTLGRPRPALRRYYRFVLPELEAERGLEGLHAALEDEDGLFRHNVAERLGELGDPRSVAPLARHVERLLGAQPASTYEYDDAPPALVQGARSRFRDPRRSRAPSSPPARPPPGARHRREHPPRTRFAEFERSLVDPSSFPDRGPSSASRRGGPRRRRPGRRGRRLAPPRSRLMPGSPRPRRALRTAPTAGS